ncbi:murein biosynthesis integral membrane protein MurJ [Candidatus Daviesbacteria bacterium]|nr:murein biosynthesis integral membrane protein MurJ [Candidatus Daviesbacteria bacterium]
MVKNILSLLNARQNSILSGALILMVAVFASKFLGLIRDRLLVHNFDTSTASIYFAAFKLPDLLFQLLIFGAISVAFIPVFTEHLQRKGGEEAFKFASNLLNLSLLVFGLASLVAFFLIPFLNLFFAPGFTGHQKVLTDQLTRLIMISQWILVIGSFFIAVAQSYQRFIIPALAPLFYNIGIIAGIVLLSPIFGIAGPAMGAIIGSLLHMLVQIPLIRSLRFKYSLSFNIFDKGVGEVFKLMSMRNIGLIVEQINDVVGFALATLISLASPTLLTFAHHLQTVPIGLFGATIAQAALPVLSREQAQSERESFKVTLLTTLHQILFLTLPAAAILIVLRIPVVRLVFGASQFNWTDTVLTGRTVALFSLGLTAQSVILLLVRGFYALKDTKTPVIVSIISVFFNITLSMILVRVFNWDVWSLGLSYAVSINIALLLLIFFLNRKIGGFDRKSLFNPALKMILASLVAAAALYIPMKALDQLVFDTTRTVNLIILTGIASFVGISIYIFLVWFMKVRELHTFAQLLKNIYQKQVNVKSEEIVKESSTL